eukprot:TRINITY_DN1744_c0_g1_i1.p1 TRINITY_DN1744_c0_g1~~TRINITY_DN1744_c0_g1_i1.p1  ORF type:complete len:241 (-),score=43.22 TRINITY_DN1744_c0_g1_i1:202-924(-)
MKSSLRLNFPRFTCRHTPTRHVCMSSYHLLLLAHVYRFPLPPLRHRITPVLWLSNHFPTQQSDSADSRSLKSHRYAVQLSIPSLPLPLYTHKVTMATEDLINEFKGAFNVFDVDRTGSLDRNQLKTAMRQLGLKPTDEDISAMMKDADNGSGKVDANSFAAMMAEKLSKMDSQRDIVDAFECYDPEGTGSITGEQFKEILTSGSTKFTEREIRELIRVGDENTEGLVDYVKLVKHVTGGL